MFENHRDWAISSRAYKIYGIKMDIKSYNEKLKNHTNSQLKVFDSNIKDIKMKSLVEFQCNLCSHVFSKSATVALRTKVLICPNCSIHPRQRSVEQFRKTLESFGFELIAVGKDGPTDRGKSTIRYTSCGCIDTRFNGNLIIGKSFCKVHHVIRKSNSLTEEQVKEELKKMPYGSFTLLSEYVKVLSPIKLQCDKCKLIEEESFSAVKTRKGKCKNCFGSAASIHEEYISILFRDLGINFIRQYKINSFFYDFYLPDFKILVEYDGEQHATKRFYSEKSSSSDEDKNYLADQKGLQLIRISHTANVLLSVLEIYENVQRLSRNGVDPSGSKDTTTSLKAKVENIVQSISKDIADQKDRNESNVLI